jgi:hypothetical protein
MIPAGPDLFKGYLKPTSSGFSSSVGGVQFSEACLGLYEEPTGVAINFDPTDGVPALRSTARTVWREVDPPFWGMF